MVFEGAQHFKAWAQAYNTGDTEAAQTAYESLLTILDAELDNASLDPIRDAVTAVLQQLGEGGLSSAAPTTTRWGRRRAGRRRMIDNFRTMNGPRAIRLRTSP